MPIGTAQGARSLYERRDGQRVTVHDIQQAKQQGERFVMLTAYDTLVAGIFDRVGVPLLLVGDTSGEVVFGYPNTVPVAMEYLVPLGQAVVRGTSHALDRCRPALRWAGAGLAGHGRPDPGAAAPLRQALRRPRRDPGGGGAHLRRGGPDRHLSR